MVFLPEEIKTEVLREALIWESVLQKLEKFPLTHGTRENSVQMARYLPAVHIRTGAIIECSSFEHFLCKW